MKAFPQIIATKAKPLFKKYRIEAAYLFGSTARGDSLKESDVDIAVLFPRNLSSELSFKKRLSLGHELSILLRKNVDLVTLDNRSPSLLRKEVVSTGRLIYCNGAFDPLSFECAVIGECFDFKTSDSRLEALLS